MYSFEYKQKDAGVKLNIVKEQIRKTLRENGLCCCGRDFVCNNCKLVGTLRQKN